MKKVGIIYLLMLLVPLFWGGAFGAGKHVVTELPPFTTAAIRFGMASVLLVIWLTVQKGWDWQLMRERWKGLLFVSVTGIFAYNAFFFLGLQYTSATNGSLVVSMNPMTTTLLAVLFLGEVWNRQIGIGMVLSLLGVLTVISGGSLEVIRTLSFNVGDLILIGAVLCFSTYGIVSKAVLKGVPSLLVTTVTMTIGSLLLFAVSLFEGGWGQVPAISGQSWLELVYMAVCATVVAFVIWNMGIARLGPSKASAYVNLVPINAMWISSVFYGESLHLSQLVGVVLVIGGVVLTTRAPGKKTAPLPQKGAEV